MSTPRTPSRLTAPGAPGEPGLHDGARVHYPGAPDDRGTVRHYTVEGTQGRTWVAREVVWDTGEVDEVDEVGGLPTATHGSVEGHHAHDWTRYGTPRRVVPVAGAGGAS